MRLKDKIALVTGGTSGIGRAVAELFAEEGAAVTITGRRRDLGEEVVTGIGAKGGRANFAVMDVRQLPQVRAGIEETARRQGRLDILVNNAGISLPRTYSPRVKQTTRTSSRPMSVPCSSPRNGWPSSWSARASEASSTPLPSQHSGPGGAGGLLWHEGRSHPDHACCRPRTRSLRGAGQRRLAGRRRYTAAAQRPLSRTRRTRTN